MAIFGKRQGGEEAQQKRQALIQSFEEQLHNQETILYGVALFFECISTLLADDPAVLETYRKQFRNIIQTGRDCSAKAAALLDKAKSDSKAAPMLEQFKITSCDAHPSPEVMRQRAVALVAAYDEAFPGRDRTQPFSEDDIMLLMHTASETIALAPSAAAE